LNQNDLMKAHSFFILVLLGGIGVVRCQTVATNAANATTTPAVESVPPPAATPQFSAAELEKMAMPIALYPDPLISIILPASAYPIEVVQAARFVKDTNNIAKVDDQPWDENVKALAKFPQAIDKLNQDLNWTIDLGHAFIEQPKELMDTIQSLRAKAHDAGTLRDSDQQKIVVTNEVVYVTNVSSQVTTETKEVVYIQPANPQVVYVPSYPPTVYYPPPAYVYDPYAPLISFGVGITMGAIIANNCDWHGGCVYNDVDVDIDRNVDRERNVNRERNTTGERGNRASQQGGRSKWQPNQERLRNNAGGSAASREARGYGSGANNRAAAGNTGARPAAGNRASTGAGAGAGAGARPSTGNNAARPTTGNNARSQPSAGNRSSGGNSAFGGVGNGSSARQDSSRGRSSRSGGGIGGGGGGGPRGGGGGGGGRRR